MAGIGKPGRPKEFEVRVSSSITRETWDELDRLGAELGLEGPAPKVRAALDEFVRLRRAERQAMPAA